MNFKVVLGLLVLGVLVFGGDYYFFQEANTDVKTAVAYHNNSDFNVIKKDKHLSKVDKKTYYSIDVDEIVWYQEKYKQVKHIDCREYEDQPFERNYLVDRSTFEKNRLLNKNLDREIKTDKKKK